MSFPPSVRKEALLRSRRSCCVCREFAGRDVNVHHIIPYAEGGSNDIDNAIVLCLKCHSEAGHYNNKHSIGNKYSRDELREHRDKFWELCSSSPNTPLPVSPIRVSPARIHMSSGTWNTVDEINVYNSSREMYFQIWVKLTLGKQDSDWSDVKIEHLKPKVTIFARTDLVALHGSIFRIDGIDEEGNKAIYIMSHSLNMGEVFRFMVTSQQADDSHVRNSCPILVELLSFDTEPMRMAESSKEAALRITPPEEIEIKSITVLLSRI